MENKWISVDEKLPELTEPLTCYSDEVEDKLEVLAPNWRVRVWAYSTSLGIIHAELCKATGWSEISSCSIKGVNDITHWQPLPAPPSK